MGLGVLVVLEAAAALSQFLAQRPFPLATVFITMMVLALMVRFHGVRWALFFLALVFLIPFGSEFPGVLAGIPFGPYQYGAVPGPWVLGTVPLFIYVAWVNISYLVLLTTTLAVGRSSIKLAPVDGLVATGWDAIVDPLAVAANYWTWEAPGVLHGVPISNFVGWFVVVTALSAALRWTSRRTLGIPTGVPRAVALLPPLILLVNTLRYAAVALHWGFLLSAALGPLIVLPLVFLALSKAWRGAGPSGAG